LEVVSNLRSASRCINERNVVPVEKDHTGLGSLENAPDLRPKSALFQFCELSDHEPIIGPA
jgi:hypothetical protein